MSEGIDLHALPVWPVKRAATFLNVHKQRVMKMLQLDEDGNLTYSYPEGCPQLEGIKDESNRWQITADSVRALKEFMDSHPDAFKGGGGRTAGTRMYKIYLDEEQVKFISEYAESEGIRFVLANPPKPKEESSGTPSAPAPGFSDDDDED